MLESLENICVAARENTRHAKGTATNQCTIGTPRSQLVGFAASLDKRVGLLRLGELGPQRIWTGLDGLVGLEILHGGKSG